MDVFFVEGEDNSLFDVLENIVMFNIDFVLEYCELLCCEIECLLLMLMECQCDVIKFYFGIGVEYLMLLEDIGDKFGFICECVCQIKDKVINKFCFVNCSKFLKYYLGV